MIDNRSNKNRRGSERLDTTFTLTYQIERPLALRVQLGYSDDIDALMSNLSDSGMAIITKHNLPVGTQLYIKCNIIDLHLEGEERLSNLEIIGETLSNVALSALSHKIGIRFIKISDADKAAISSFVKRNKLFPKA